MKGFLKTKTFKIFAAAVVILAGVIVFSQAAGGSFINSIISMVSTPMQSVSARASDNLTEFIDIDGLSKNQLKKLNEELNAENAELRNQLLEYYNLKKENDQLKVQLGIKIEMPEWDLIAATVTSRNPNEVFSSFSIDRGYLSGVSVDDAVITTNGLVGRVSQVYATSSRVTCILSEDLQIAAISVNVGESGVISGNVQFASNGKVRLNYLKSETEITEGTIITTSGAGGMFPKDIMIGEVESIRQSEYDISKYAVIKPFEDVRNVTDVFVVSGFPGKEDIIIEDDPAASSVPLDDPEAKR